MNDLAYAIAKGLFPRPSTSSHWCDDGWGGIDDAAVEKRWQEKAALIRPHLQSLMDENALLRAAYNRALAACEFIRDEQESLGLRLGQGIIEDGVPALRRQRDMLVRLLAEGRGR